MKLLRRVCRTFDGDGHVRIPGEVVDATDWKNRVEMETGLLIETVDPTVTLLEGPDGRLFSTQEALDRCLAREEYAGARAKARGKEPRKRKVAKRTGKASKSKRAAK